MLKDRCLLKIILYILPIIFTQNLLSQNCNNLDFESCNYSGWELYLGENRGKKVFTYQDEEKVTEWKSLNSAPESVGYGARPIQHYIASGGSYVIPGQSNKPDVEIPLVYPGSGNCSAVLGDFEGNRRKVSIIRRTFEVTPANDVLLLRYAVVLEDPEHDTDEQPYFMLNASTSTGEPINCLQYSAISGDGQEGWERSGDITFKPWAEVFVPLSDYIGETLTIEVVVADCSKGGHFGFACVDLQCGSSLDVRQVDGCSFPYSIIGPDGAASYTWSTGQTTKDIEVNTPGNYTVEVIPFTGQECSVVFEAEVKKLDSLTLRIEGDNRICLGDSTQLKVIGGAETFQWLPVEGISDPTSPNPFIRPTQTTTYTVQGIAKDGCVGRTTFTVEVLPLPVIDAGEDLSVCEGESVKLKANGGTSYTWSPSQNIDDPTDENPTYRPKESKVLTVTGTSAEGCSATDEVMVSIIPPFDLNISQDTTICEGESVQLNASGAETYSWKPANSLSSIDITNPIATPTKTTTYTVTGSKNGSCKSTAKVKIKVSKINVDAGPDITVCRGSSVKLNVKGAKSYSWSPIDGLSDPNSPSPTVQPANPISYVVTGTNDFGCVETDSINVLLTEKFELQVNSDTTICSGDSINLSVIGGSNYTWKPANTLSEESIANPTAFPQYTTTYIVNAEDGQGCQDSASVHIRVNPGVKGEANPDLEICLGETASLSATGAEMYQWIPSEGLSDPNSANPVASLDSTTTFRIIASNANGCQKEYETTVAVNPVPEVFAGADQLVCIGATVMLQAEGADNYVWAPAGRYSDNTIANPEIIADQTAEYIVNGINSFGCSDADTVLIAVGEENDPFAGLDLRICAGESIQLNASASGAISWQPSSGLSSTNILDPVASPTQTTTYVLRSTDAIGCVGEDRITIEVNPLPDIEAGPDLSACPGDTISFNASGGISYEWTPATYLSDNLSTNPSLIPTGPITYSLKGTDANGCTNFDEISVWVVEKFDIDAGEDLFICFGDSTRLTVEGGSSYTWTPSISISNDSIANPYAFPSQTTTYRIIANNDNDCFDMDSVTVVVADSIPLRVEPSYTICEGESVQIQASGAKTYEWTPTAYLNSRNIPNPITSPPGDQRYSLRASDGNGCFTSGEVIIRVIPLPDVYAGRDTSVCPGDIVAFTGASGADIYSWESLQILGDRQQRTPLVDVQFDEWIIVTGSRDGCSDRDSLFATLLPVPQANTSDVAVCQGDSIMLIASGADSFIWNQSDSVASILVAPMRDTSFSVIPMSKEGCMGNVDSVFVEVIPYPIASFSVADSVGVHPFPIEIQNTSKNGSRYEWNFGDGTGSSLFNPSHTYKFKNTYELRLIAFNELGCPDTMITPIMVEGYAIYAPTAFSPNGDGDNDFYSIRSYNFRDAEVKIFSRLGMLIYEATDLDFRWDGKYNGADVPEGVYVCKIEGTNDAGKKVSLVTTVTLIR